MGEALGGADGASAAGTNEMLMPLLVGLAGNSPERLRALSRIVGGASTGNAQGAWIAEQGTTWNRQLHQNEVIAIRDQAKAYAETQGISESEALSALLLEGMRQVDEDYAGNILANPEAASFLQQIAQSDPDNSLVSTDGKVTGFFEASDHDYGTFDAYKWQLWDVENGWYPGGVEDPNLLSQTFKDPQNILMLGKGEAYYDFRDLYQQVSGESASKANTQNLMILGSTAGSLGAIRLAGLASTEAGLLASNPTSYFYSQGYKLTLMADEAVAGLAGFPTGVVFGGGGAMLLDNMASGGGRYAATLLDDASSLGAFGRGVDSNPGQFRFFEVDGGGAPRELVVSNKLSPYGTTIEREIGAIHNLGQRSVSAETLTRRNKIDELSYDTYVKQAEKDIYSQNTIYRYLTESGYNASLRHDSVAGYSTTLFSEFADEVMSGAQITKQWPGRPATGDVIYRVEIPTSKLNGFSIPRPNGGDAKIGW